MGFQSAECVNIIEKSLSFIILSIHIGLSAWSSAYVFHSFVDELKLMELLDAMNFLLHYTFGALTYWIIIYDSCTKYRLEVAFWRMFEKTHDGIYSQSNFPIWSYLSPLICLLSGDILSSTMALTFENTSDSYTKVMEFTFMWIYDNRGFFYFLHLKVIAAQLQEIEIEIERLKTHFNEKRFEWIHDRYKMLHEMCEMVNAIFELSNVAILLFSFHSAVTFLNFVYRQVHNKFIKFNSGSNYLHG